MNPFDSFPEVGKRRLGIPKPGNASCRTGYGKALQHLTGQTTCAYCGIDLTTDYYRWLLMTVDHVVPRGHGTTAGIPVEFIEDAFNLVIACSGCNGFANRYTWKGETPTEWTDDSFADFRDLIFLERKLAIDIRREKEIALFATRPWEVAAPNLPASNGTQPIIEPITFADNDAGYLAWIDAHPTGFVVNALRTPKSGPVLLHRAGCKFITGTPPNGNVWTGEYIKHCSDDFQSLDDWAFQATGEPARRCKLCHPAPKQDCRPFWIECPTLDSFPCPSVQFIGLLSIRQVLQCLSEHRPGARHKSHFPRLLDSSTPRLLDSSTPRLK